MSIHGRLDWLKWSESTLLKTSFGGTYNDCFPSNASIYMARLVRTTN